MRLTSRQHTRLQQRSLKHLNTMLCGLCLWHKSKHQFRKTALSELG